MLHTNVQRDLAGQSVPLIAKVATSSGRYHLPNWGKSRSINHSITIGGYNDKAGTYTYIDTCGPGCNNTGARGGCVHRVADGALGSAGGRDGPRRDHPSTDAHGRSGG